MGGARSGGCRCGGARASLGACLAVCALLLAYNLLGGFLFLALEGAAPAGAGAAAASQAEGGALRARTVERLWAITEDLNILYKENWTALAARELAHFQRALLLRAAPPATAPAGPRPTRPPPAPDDDHRWTFATSFLYALTLITTIGHGNVTPQSAAGRAAAVAYACAGIPLVLVYLATLGDALARRVRALYSRLRPPRPPRPARVAGERPRRTPFEAALNLETLRGGRSPPPCPAHAPVPAALGAALAAGYVALGAALFHATERWSLLDAAYFSFSSLATIGLGPLRPGRAAQTPRAHDAAVGACCAYILVGIAVVAMCFNLVHEDACGGLRALAARCAGGAGSGGGGGGRTAPAVASERLALALVS